MLNDRIYGVQYWHVNRHGEYLGVSLVHVFESIYDRQLWLNDLTTLERGETRFTELGFEHTIEDAIKNKRFIVYH